MLRKISELVAARIVSYTKLEEDKEILCIWFTDHFKYFSKYGASINSRLLFSCVL